MSTKFAARTAGLALIAAGALVLAGCSEGEKESPPQEDTFTPTATAEPGTQTATPTDSDAANAALDGYVALELKQRDQILDTFKDTYSDFTVQPQYPDTVLYTYTYLNELDPAAAGAALEEVASTMQDSADTIIFPAMEAAGVADPKVTFVYLNPDGSEIWSKTFEPS